MGMILSMGFIFIKKLFSFVKSRKGRNDMAVISKKRSAFVVDSDKIDLFLNQKSSKRNDRIIKDRADALRKVLHDETKKK